MLTEEQAREKWCPMVRLAEATAPPGYPSRNRGTSDSGVHPLCRCIASECMAWRWGKRNRKQYEALCQEETGQSRSDWMTAYLRARGGTAQEAYEAFCREFASRPPTHGYCGAFGKPGDA